VYEWISVCLAGGIGGLANADLDLIDAGEGERSGGRQIVIWFATIFVGAVAGFIFWGLNASGGHFDSVRADPARIAGAVIAGLGGARLLRQYATSRQAEETSQKLGNSMKDFANLFSQQAQTSGEGAEHADE
jgi:hypothetical protein